MDRQRNLAVGSFGRRGADAGAQSPVAARPIPAPAAPAPSEPADGEPPVGLVAFVLLAFLGLICLDAIISGTSLVTPISPTFVNMMRGIGFVFGIPTGLVLAFNPAVGSGPVRKGVILVANALVALAAAARRSAWSAVAARLDRLAALPSQGPCADERPE